MPYYDEIARYGTGSVWGNWTYSSTISTTITTPYISQNAWYTWNNNTNLSVVTTTHYPPEPLSEEEKRDAQLILKLFENKMNKDVVHENVREKKRNSKHVRYCIV